jgi:hypothetical protein
MNKYCQFKANIGKLVSKFGNRPMPESQTRNFLIDPILRELGYDNPDNLGIEEQLSKEKRPDYELRYHNDKFPIEAKSNQNKISDTDQLQLLQYTVHYPHKYGVITNGQIWRICGHVDAMVDIDTMTGENLEYLYALRLDNISQHTGFAEVLEEVFVKHMSLNCLIRGVQEDEQWLRQAIAKQVNERWKMSAKYGDIRLRHNITIGKTDNEICESTDIEITDNQPPPAVAARPYVRRSTRRSIKDVLVALGETAPLDLQFRYGDVQTTVGIKADANDAYQFVFNGLIFDNPSQCMQAIKNHYQMPKNIKSPYRQLFLNGKPLATNR